MIWIGKQTFVISTILIQTTSTQEIITWAASFMPKHVIAPLQTGASTVSRKKISDDALALALLHLTVAAPLSNSPFAMPL